uniref:peptidoglycan recognition protein family protein n=1 Tax=Agathobacter sp. TaxID=2021311 RepID=UPI003FED64AA
MAVTKAIKAIAKQLFANPKNYGDKRSLKSIKYIVIHYTANDGDTDEANAKYFHNNVVKASAHYFVDDDSYTKSVPLKNIAWSVGGKKYLNCGKTGGGKKYGLCTNANSINIELCDTVRDGKAGASAATIQNAVTLTKKLMKKYNIDKAHVIRHFDVTGKPCPAYWTDDKKWKKEFLDKL